MRFSGYLLALATLGFISCSGNESAKGEVKEVTNNNSEKIEIADGAVNINGTVSGSNGETIYLFKYGVNPFQILDSTKINEDGSFSISHNLEGYIYAGVGFQANNAALVIIGPNDEISLFGSLINWTRDYQVTGTGYSPEMRDYLLERQAFVDQISGLKTEASQVAPSGPAMEEINAKGIALQEAFIKKRNDFITKMDDSPSLFIAFQDIYDPISDVEQVKKIAKATNKYMPNSLFADQINTALAQIEQQIAYAEQKASSQGEVAIGKSAPELTFQTPEGKTLSLSSLKGNVVLLDFWASWCKPCRMENPNVVKLYNQYKDKGFTVFSVSLDNNKTKWVDAIQADGLIWPNHVSDLGGWNSLGAAIYGVNSIPQTYLIDANGTIIAKDLRGDDLAKKLKEILG